MQKRVPYRVILPENYRRSEKKYPVFFLLHGLFGSCENWLELTRLTEYASGKDLIMVLPEAENSWYTNSATKEKNKFESFFTEEFIPEIDRLYKTIGKRESRAIAGLSMGGYGALKFGFKRPDLFVFAGSMSGAFDAPNQSASNPGAEWENLSDSVLEVFGDENSRTRAENDLFRIIERIDCKTIKSLPQLYIDCGTEDSFLEANRKLADLLRRKLVPFEYLEVSGSHEWPYWDERLRYILTIIEKKLSVKNR